MTKKEDTMSIFRKKSTLYLVAGVLIFFCIFLQVRYMLFATEPEGKILTEKFIHQICIRYGFKSLRYAFFGATLLWCAGLAFFHFRDCLPDKISGAYYACFILAVPVLIIFSVIAAPNLSARPHLEEATVLNKDTHFVNDSNTKSWKNHLLLSNGKDIKVSSSEYAMVKEGDILLLIMNDDHVVTFYRSVEYTPAEDVEVIRNDDLEAIKKAEEEYLPINGETLPAEYSGSDVTWWTAVT